MKQLKRYYLFILCVAVIAAGILSINSCGKDVPVARYKTEYVILVFIDGPRLTETWGDPTHQYIPRFANDLAPQGVVYSHFRNDGPTYTNAGHTAGTTGHYQEINNGGTELPQRPSFFQHWLKHTGESPDKAWLVTSKDKLQVLTNCNDSNWSGEYMPSNNCGVNGGGVGAGYRDDHLTWDVVLSTMETHHPKLMLVNFRQPDGYGHDGNWNAYVQSIRDTDEYIYQLWNFIQNDPIYKDKTAMIVTNDHGRHLDNVANGFVSHGDNCEGCRRINCLALGPDFKRGVVTDKVRGLIDIPTTIAEILQFPMPTGDGEVMEELFLPL